MEFFSTGGGSLVRELEQHRDSASAQMNFEEAARLHKSIEKARDSARQSPELAADLERLNGVVVQAAAASSAVALFPVWRGFILDEITFPLEMPEGKPVSMDARLKEALGGIRFTGGSPRVRGEHLALLARWFYRGTRKGEFVAFDTFEKPPYRRIVGAISRVVRQSK